MYFTRFLNCLAAQPLWPGYEASPVPCYLSPGAHQPPKVAKERQTQHVGSNGSSSPSHVQDFTLHSKRPLRKSVKNKLTFVQYPKGLPL